MDARVETKNGAILGVARADHLRFLGVPFAAAPVGPRRFLPPQPLSPWAGVREAKTFGCAAPQPPARVKFMDAGVPTDEDCLYLNIYTPSLAGKRPVMVWIHGGGFSLGSGSQPAYNGATLCARGDVVVVSINYRLGLLGYLVLDEHGGDRWGASANLGQLDQIAALRWVRDNIAAFGGDPDNVTIFGESAGGAAVATLLAMPAAQGLFHKAIAQSGTAGGLLPVADHVAVTAAVLEELSLDASSSQRLQALPLRTLIQASRAAEAKLAQAEGGIASLLRRTALSPYFPAIDGKTLPAAPLSAVADGAALGVPLIVGTNRDESKFGDALSGAPAAPIDDARLLRKVGRLMGVRDGESARDAVEVYRRSRREHGLPSSNSDILSAMTTDRTQRIPAIRLAEAQRRHEDHSYNYLFCWEQPQLKAAIHGLEIGFIFGHVGKGDDPLMQLDGDSARGLSEHMLLGWTMFARCGSPHRAELPWAPYDDRRRATMVYDERSAVVDAPFDSERAVWDGIA